MSYAVTSWKCEYCGKTYDEQKKADFCESQHAKMKDVMVSHYSGKYPELVTVYFDDGSNIVYGRD